ncbi:hypothetical protein [Yinghuangia soli]|uniref:Uncharacterized protein n=1 Tax=Yinghuangia soli TaxID=2908204 RepID=A0AA41U4T0_9ACTN|nr:hypothetical protein [Yinghuangia soli]MCF2533281.1 hypothetical protein [Yinghuangia soli]
MALPGPVANGTWNVVPGEGGKLPGSEFLHGAVHHVTYTYPAGGAPTSADYKLDGQWTNSSNAAAVFKTATMLPVRTLVSTALVPNLTKNACLLDSVIALVVTLPVDWEWCPGPTVNQAFDVNPLNAPIGELCNLAHHLLAMRSTIEARSRQMKKLNVPEVTITTDIGRPTVKTASYRINWVDVLNGGRDACIKALRKGPPTPMISGPPSKNPANGEMNKLIGADMFKADNGLIQMEKLGLIDLEGMSGRTFAPTKGKLVKMEPDRSDDLHAAYNHIRFLLYMEWRGLHELLQ